MKPLKLTKYTCMGFVIANLVIISVFGANSFVSKRKLNTAQQNTKVSPINVVPTNTIYTYALTPAPSHVTVTDSGIRGWKKYINHLVGYSIDVPASWPVEVYENEDALKHQGFGSNLRFVPVASDEERYGAHPRTAIIDIAFPVPVKGPQKDFGVNYENGLKGLESSVQSGSDRYTASRTTSYTSIDDYTALIVKTIVKPEASVTYPPSPANGRMCDQCVGKVIYIDMENGSILSIRGGWGKERPKFEALFDNAVSTIKFID